MDGTTLRDLVSARIRHWAPPLRRLVAEADVATVAPVPLRSMPPLPEWRPSNVTLLGDAIHNMAPMAGIGANTALRDAEVLCAEIAGATGRQSTVGAIGEYERRMREYANRAIALSRRNAEKAASAETPAAQIAG